MAAPSLYVHIPFCSHKCEYCAFYSHPPGPEEMARFTDALIKEWKMLVQRVGKLSPRTIFFGGGTPSLLPIKQWELLLEAIHQLTDLSQLKEWTVECNPATVSREKAAVLAGGGVTRVSMGVQSFDPLLLERLGRIHTVEQVYQSYEILRNRFEQVNIDFMFAIPTQTMEVWKQTIQKAVALQPNHLSTYEVTYEEDTPLFHQLNAGKIELDEDLAIRMSEQIVSDAEAAGYQQYEISNFAKPGCECLHNLNYWQGGDWFALGPGAEGHEGTTHYKNIANTSLYIEQLEKGTAPENFRETLTPEQAVGELAAFAFRQTKGFSLGWFQSRTGVSLKERYREELQELQNQELILLNDDWVRLTDLGKRYCDTVAASFVVARETR